MAIISMYQASGVVHILQSPPFMTYPARFSPILAAHPVLQPPGMLQACSVRGLLAPLSWVCPMVLSARRTCTLTLWTAGAGRCLPPAGVFGVAQREF